MKKTINTLVYLLLFSIFFLDGFLGDGLNGGGLHILPGKLSWICEIISVLITFYILLLFALKKKIGIPNVYFFVFFLFGICVLASTVLNTVPSGAFFAGMRRYLQFFPFFFLPGAYFFSESELRKQIKFIFMMNLIQIPFVFYQRFVLFKYTGTGDVITGSLLSSTVLTLVQIISICVLSAVYAKKHIKLSVYICFLILLFIPTAMNETKVTLFLAPIAVAAPMFFGNGRILDIKKIFLASTSVALIMTLFVLTYNTLYSTDLGRFFSTENSANRGAHSVTGYLYKGLTKEDVDNEVEPGRIDSLLFPFKLIKDPFNLVFGFGIGNVNMSGIRQFSGEYTHYSKYGAGKVAAAGMIWEVGFLGLLLYLLLFALLFRDGLQLRNEDGYSGALSLSWIAVTIVLFISIFYANIFHIKAIGYLFFYGSGIVAAMRSKMRLKEMEKNTN